MASVTSSLRVGEDSLTARRPAESRVTFADTEPLTPVPNKSCVFEPDVPGSELPHTHAPTP